MAGRDEKHAIMDWKLDYKHHDDVMLVSSFRFPVFYNQFLASGVAPRVGWRQERNINRRLLMVGFIANISLRIFLIGKT